MNRRHHPTGLSHGAEPATRAPLLEDFAAFAAGRPGIEPDVAELLVDVKGVYFGDADPTRWRVEQVRELLADVLPRKVVASPEWFAAVVPTTRLFVTYLRDRQLLHRSGAPADALLAELDRLERAEASSDDRAGPDGLAADPLAAADGLDDLVPLGAGGRGALPPTWLAPVGDLALAVRSAPLVGLLRRFAVWTAPRRPVTQRGLLPLADAREACAQLGLPLPPTSGRRPRHSRDLPELHRLWELAVATDLVSVQHRHATPGPAAALLTGHADPEEVVGWWNKLLDSAIAWGLDLLADPEEAALPAGMAEDLLNEVDVVLTGSLVELYRGVVPPAPALEQVVADAISQEHPARAPIAQVRDRLVLRRWRAHLGQLAELGAVDLTADTVTLTPLGRAGVRGLLLDAGFDAPLGQDPRTLAAEGLLDALSLLGGPLAENLITAWLAARSAGAATADLLRSAANGTAKHRYGALSVLAERLGDHLRGPGRADAECWRDHPLIGLYVRLLLLGPGQPSDLTATDRQWMALESVAVATETGDLDYPEPAEKIWQMVVEDGDVESAWRCAHPQLAQILETLMAHHPTDVVRRAAKKSLFKLRQQTLRT